MSKIFDFKKRFGKEITLEEVKSNFVTKINHHLIPVIDDQIGHYYSASNSGSRLFDYICINFSLDPGLIVKNWNRNSYDGTHSLFSIARIINNDFDKVLLLIEIVYDYFSNDPRIYQAKEIVDHINLLVNQSLLQPISLGVFWRGGRFYPVGASELDEKLIQEPLDWLSEYPKVQGLYKNALDHYAHASASDIKRKDACINAYQAVEAMAKIIEGEEKPFDSLFGSFGETIGLNSNWKKILNQYREFSMEYGRHPGRSNDFIPDGPSTEAFVYLSGLLLRLSVKKISQNNGD